MTTALGGTSKARGQIPSSGKAGNEGVPDHRSRDLDLGTGWIELKERQAWMLGLQDKARNHCFNQRQAKTIFSSGRLTQQFVTSRLPGTPETGLAFQDGFEVPFWHLKPALEVPFWDFKSPNPGPKKGKPATSEPSQTLIPAQQVEATVFLIRKHNVLQNKDLANIRADETKVLNNAVRRNPGRFPLTLAHVSS
jgi:hypothetical protein